MHAVIKTGGKQYRVAAGDKLNVELDSQTVTIVKTVKSALNTIQNQ